MNKKATQKKSAGKLLSYSLAFSLLVFALNISNAQVVISSDASANPDPSAMLDVQSTSKGLLIPRMSTTQRDAISSPADGLMIYNSTTNKYNLRQGGAWVEVGSGNGSVTSVDVSGGTTGLTTSGGAVTSTGTITLAGTLDVDNGGTGATTLTGIVKGNGTSAFTAATAGTDYVAPGGALGTPSSGTLTNATGLPISTGVSGLGTDVATFLATPSSANLASAITDETGTGAVVFATSPTLSGLTVNGTTNINVNNNAATNIGTGTTTSSVTIGGSAAQTIAIGDNATGAKTITIGNTAANSSVNLRSGGTGTISIASASTAAVNINANTGTATPVNIGTGTTTGAVSIGNASAVTLGAPGTSATNGVRIAGSRVVFSKSAVALTLPTSPTVSNILDRSIFTLSAATTVQVPSAASVVAGLPGTAAIGDIFQFLIVNTSASARTVSFTATTGWTFINSNPSIAANSSRLFWGQVTNVTSGSEAITLYY